MFYGEIRFTRCLIRSLLKAINDSKEIDESSYIRTINPTKNRSSFELMLLLFFILLFVFYSRLFISASRSLICASRFFNTLSFPMMKNVGMLCTLY